MTARPLDWQVRLRHGISFDFITLRIIMGRAVRRDGRVAECTSLLRLRLEDVPIRGFESLSLRHLSKANITRASYQHQLDGAWSR